jgi:hypothetical protein
LARELAKSATSLAHTARNALENSNNRDAVLDYGVDLGHIDRWSEDVCGGRGRR